MVEYGDNMLKTPIVIDSVQLRQWCDVWCRGLGS